MAVPDMSLSARTEDGDVATGGVLGAEVEDASVPPP